MGDVSAEDPPPALGGEASQDDGGAGDAPGADVVGLDSLLQSARIPQEIRSRLRDEVASTGALNVEELSRSDWAALHNFQRLREMEKRRVLAFVPPWKYSCTRLSCCRASPS